MVVGWGSGWEVGRSCLLSLVFKRYCYYALEHVIESRKHNYYSADHCRFLCGTKTGTDRRATFYSQLVDFVSHVGVYSADHSRFLSGTKAERFFYRFFIHDFFHLPLSR